MAAQPQPVDAVVAVTHLCNARCVMCNIWRQSLPDTLGPQHLHRLPDSLRTVNLSGGEPFLRDDLPELVAAVRSRCRHATITLSTNALAVERTVSMMHEIGLADPRVRVAVSIDGIGDVHDHIRGVDGAFERTMETVDRLCADGCRGVRLSMTVGPDNAHQVAAVADLANGRGLELGIVAAQAAETQLHVAEIPTGVIGSGSRRAFEATAGTWLRSWRPKQWLRAHFTAMTWRYLLGERWDNLSRPGEEFFFLQSDGTVHTSSVAGEAMGSIIESEWDELWSSPQAEAAREAERSRRHTSWMICTARRYYRRRPMSVAWWIMRQKLQAHFRRLRLPTPSARAIQEGGACAHSAH